MNVAKQKGFTLVELVIGLAAIAALGGVCATVYVVCHFVAKFW